MSVVSWAPRFPRALRSAGRPYSQAGPIVVGVVVTVVVVVIIIIIIIAGSALPAAHWPPVQRSMTLHHLSTRHCNSSISSLSSHSTANFKNDDQHTKVQQHILIVFFGSTCRLKRRGSNKSRLSDHETTNQYKETNDVNSFVHELAFGANICFGREAIP